jgi:hypothetical protein
MSYWIFVGVVETDTRLICGDSKTSWFENKLVVSALRLCRVDWIEDISLAEINSPVAS